MKVSNPYNTPTDEFMLVRPSAENNSESELDFKRLSDLLDQFELLTEDEKLKPLENVISHIRWKIRVIEKGEGDRDPVFVTGQIIMQTRALVKSAGFHDDTLSSLYREASEIAKKIGFQTPAY